MYLALRRMLAAGTLTPARVEAALSTRRITQAQAIELLEQLPPADQDAAADEPAAAS